MRITSLLAAGLLVIWSTTSAGEFAADRLHNWHQWRGPEANGYAPYGDPPVEWNEQTNVKWKVAIPGAGSASPIVWGNSIYLLTAVKTDRIVEGAAQPEPEQPREEERPQRRRGHRSAPPTSYYQFVVLCLDRETGQIRWQQIAREEVPHEGHHPTHGFASASATTDGEYLYASFGSRGTYCYDLDGNLLWERDFGDMRTRNRFGEGTSPVLHQDSLIVNWDHEGDSFIIALDAKSGEAKWKVERDAQTTWNTPLVVDHAGRTQIVVNAKTRTRSYDLATGELIWECGGQMSNPIPSPVALDGVVYCMTGFRGYALYAIPLGADGDVTDSDRIAWRRDSGTPYVPSPLLFGTRLYFTKSNNAILTSVDAKTGEPLIDEQRLPGLRSLYASPVGAAGRVYFVGRDGTTLVIAHADDLKILATNQLDDPIDASPAIVGGQIYLRGAEHLYCLSAD